MVQGWLFSPQMGTQIESRRGHSRAAESALRPLDTLLLLPLKASSLLDGPLERRIAASAWFDRWVARRGISAGCWSQGPC